MAFGFRLRLRLEHGRTIEGLSGVASFELSPDFPTVELKVVQAASSTGGEGLDLRAEGFDTEAEALNAGFRLQSALLLASLRRGYGIVMTPRVPGGTFTSYAKQLAAEQTGATVHDDVYGLRVYENPETAIFLLMGEIGMSVGERLEATLQSWRDAFHPARGAEDKVLVSYDLFAHSRFESSSRARFLLLVMAIEALLQQGERPKNEIIALDNAIAAIRRSDLPDERQNALAGTIGQLKRESIGAAARAYLGRAKAAGVISHADPGGLFHESYRTRSGMVHEGATPSPAELSDRSNQLESILKDLLIAIFEGRWASQAIVAVGA